MRTEAISPRYSTLDQWKPQEVVQALWASQSHAVAACLPVLPTLVAAVEAAAARLKRGGRLFYVGAGSAGAMAAVDGIELRATFGFPSARTVILLASGLDFSRGMPGGHEDDSDAGRLRMLDYGCDDKDVVIGVSASGASVFTTSAVQEGRARGALTIGLSSVAHSPLIQSVEHPLVTDTGEEVIAGSTRLGAGTAQKVVLNLFSTALMVRCGAVHGNMMVNLRPENDKERQRAIAIIQQITDCKDTQAEAALAEAGDAKHAVLLVSGMSLEQAKAALARSGGVLGPALAEAHRR